MGKKALIYLILSITGIFMLFPFYWMFVTSLKTQPESLMFPPTLFPRLFKFYNYIEVFNTVPFARYILNTVIVTFFVVLGILMTSILAAYAFARIEFPGREIYFTFLIGLMQVPLPLYLVPSYILLSKLGWIDTYLALIVPWTANIFAIFLLRQFFKTVPRELIESAKIDGCGHFTILTKILLPLAKAPLAAIIVLNTIGSWNSFVWPLIVTNSDSLRPIQVGLAYFSRAESTNYPLLMAASFISILPLLIVYIIAQKFVVESFSYSGLKY